MPRRENDRLGQGVGAPPPAELVRGFGLRALPAGFLDDPYPWYDALRAHAPLRRGPDGALLLTRRADCLAVYRDGRSFSSDKKVEFAPKFGDGPLYRHHTTSLVFNDPPLHTRVRKLLAPAFTPRALALLQPRLEALVDGLLDQAAARGGMDVIGDYAAALPVAIVGDVLGIPAEVRPSLRRWSLAILGALEPVLMPEARARGETAVQELETFPRRHIAEHRAGRLATGGAVLGLLVDREIDGERLSDEELVQNCIFLLNAGHETTTNLIGNGVAAVLDHPGQLASLRGDPRLIDSAVEELLRFESLNQLGNRRVVRPVELAGKSLEPGQLVTIGIGAAKRDAAQLAQPHRLDLARTPNRHLAFGGGAHTCLGATLARLEGRIAIGRLVTRFAGLRRAGPCARGGRARFRGFLHYPVAV
jgi:hypothetical protein